jgi:hypothetical protein
LDGQSSQFGMEWETLNCPERRKSHYPINTLYKLLNH